MRLLIFLFVVAALAGCATGARDPMEDMGNEALCDYAFARRPLTPQDKASMDACLAEVFRRHLDCPRRY